VLTYLVIVGALFAGNQFRLADRFRQMNQKQLFSGGDFDESLALSAAVGL